MKDIAEEMLGSNAYLLLTRYMQNSKPTIVSFIDKASNKHLELGLFYLWKIENGADKYETLENGFGLANRPEGHPITPEKLIEIEEMNYEFSLPRKQ